jgi:hypothetical protein
VICMGKKKKFKKVYIPLFHDEDFDWRWERDDVMKLDELWKLGYNIITIADYFHRDPDEVLVLLFDRMRKGRLEQRAGGLTGTIT